MGRRCRHISYKALGAALAYDARRVSASDGDSLSSLADLTGNGWTASQGTSGEQPIFRTGGNGINGTPAIVFDGINDNMTHSYAQPGSGGDQCQFTVAQGISGTATPAGAPFAATFSSSPASTLVTLLPALVLLGDVRLNGGAFLDTGIAGTIAAAEMYNYQSGTLTADTSGTRSSATVSPYSGDTNQRQRLNCSVYTPPGYLETTNAKIGAILAFNSAMPVPMQRRVLHMLSHSFKIPYS
jgi:hypothetical protein